MSADANIEVWYVAICGAISSLVGGRAAAVPSNFDGAEALLMSYPVVSRTKKHEITQVLTDEFVFAMVPIPTCVGRVLVCATKCYMVTEGTFFLGLSSASDADIMVYLQNEVTQEITEKCVSGIADILRTAEFELEGETEYTVIIVQDLASAGGAFFIQSAYSGLRLPRVKAYGK